MVKKSKNIVEVDAENGAKANINVKTGQIVGLKGNFTKEDKKVIELLNNSISTLSDLRNWREGAASSGISRDYDRIFGHPTRIQFKDVKRMVNRMGVAHRLLDMPATETWASPPEPQTSNQDFISAFNDLVQNHALWSYLHKVDKLSGMDEYAVLLMVREGDTNLSEEMKPLNDDGLSKIAYFQQYPGSSCKINDLVSDPRNKRYGLPASYTISASSINKGMSSTGKRLQVEDIVVHPSRILHVAEGSIDDNLIGNPRMHRHFNSLIDFKKSIGGSAEIYWFSARSGFQINIPIDVEIDDKEAKNLSNQIFRFYENLTRTIQTKGVEIKNLGENANVDPSGMFNVLISTLAMEASIPRRILLGTEAGELSSEQDRANWARFIKNRRFLFAEIEILRPLITKLIEGGVLPIVDDLRWKWPDSFVLNPLEKGRHAYDIGRTAINLRKSLEPFIAGALNRMVDDNDGESATETAKNFNNISALAACYGLQEFPQEEWVNILTEIITPQYVRFLFNIRETMPSHLDDNDDVSDHRS